MLLNTERQQQIAQFIRERKRATVPELSEHFGVSGATIWRDLEKLDNRDRYLLVQEMLEQTEFSKRLSIPNEEGKT